MEITRDRVAQLREQIHQQRDLHLTRLAQLYPDRDAQIQAMANSSELHDLRVQIETLTMLLDD